MATVNLGGEVHIKPSAVQIATNENYVSNLTTNSLRQRDVSDKLVKRYGEQGITGLMELMGSKAPSSNTTFEHYEEAFRHNSITGQYPGASTGPARALPLESYSTTNPSRLGSHAIAAVGYPELSRAIETPIPILAVCIIPTV